MSVSTAEPVSPLHPRIRARRVEVRREAGRRRLRLVLGLLVTVGTVGAGWGVTRSALLDVDKVTVAGAQHTEPAAVVEAAGLRPGQPMLDLHATGLAADIESLPWVARATVTRHWPGTVAVRITERTPAGAVRLGDGWVLADATGRVLSTTPAGAHDLVTIQGPLPADSPAPGAELAGPLLDGVRVAAAVTEAALDEVRQVTVDDGGVAVLALAGGAEARLGPTHDLDTKLAALATLFAKVDLRGVSSIDLRVPSAPVLTRG